MSRKERDRLKVIEAVREKRLKQGEAAKQLGLSVRQVKRLVRAHREEGAAGLVSQRRGQPSNRRIQDAEREEVMACVRSRYGDFGPTLAAEYLRSFHGFTHSTETLRQWMIEADAWTPKRQRRKRPFQLRERRSCIGELVQIDGSPHAWLEARGPRCTLIAFIDDATSRLQYARFEPAETTRAYLSGLRAYVTRFGRPVALYSDRHSIFTKHDPENPTPTQFERAARALTIEPILALSPQAKGRVERAFQTLQDRLVKALRLAGIDTVATANAWLPGFIAHYNARFGKTPKSSQDAHRALEVDAESLRWITSEQYPRTLSKSLSCQYQGRQYLIQTKGAPAYHLRAARITVCDDGSDDAIVLLHQGRPLSVDDLLKRREALMAQRRAAAESGVPSLAGQKVRLGGYMLPAAVENGRITGFILVPWASACSHMPPPPSNQSIRVKPARPYPAESANDPVWVTGLLSLEAQEVKLFVVDGELLFRSTYAIDGAQVEKARPVSTAPARFR